jgi:hypothetical protein
MPEGSERGKLKMYTERRIQEDGKEKRTHKTPYYIQSRVFFCK